MVYPVPQMFELSHHHCRFVYTMYNVHGMKCRCIIMYMYKMPLYLASHYASEQYEDSDSQTLYTCTHIHVHRGYNYMYVTVHAVATASYYNQGSPQDFLKASGTSIS